MLKRSVDKHEGTKPEEVEFRMKVLQYPRTAFERQVSESIMIQRNINPRGSTIGVPCPD